jgi:hypothetical protein
VDITYILGLVVLTGFGAYFSFAAIDGFGLPSQQAIATVVDQEHRNAAKGHRYEIINQRPMVTPHVTGEKYILKLDVAGRRAEGEVRRTLFEAVKPGDRVQVTFQNRRLTGRIKVLDITP